MSVAIQCLPSSSRDAAALAARLGVPFHEIAVHAFPDGEIRVTVGPASATTIIYASLDRPNDKLDRADVCRRSAAARRREAPRAGRALSVLHAAGYRLSRGRSDQPEGHRPVARAMHRPRRHRRCASASHAGHRGGISRHPVRQPLRHAGHRGRAAQDRSRSGDGRGGAGCGIPALGQRSRRTARPVLYALPERPAAATARSRSNFRMGRASPDAPH